MSQYQVKMKMDESGFPSFRQEKVNGFHISWNPDDMRLYVCPADDGVATATFAGNRKGFANAVQFAKRHDVKVEREKLERRQ